MHQLRLFFIALQFFTRIPVPAWVGFSPDWLHHAGRYLPAVGIVVGAMTALVYGLAALLWSPPVAVVLSTIAGIYLTGAFHEDGFADVCDGFGGGMTREKVFDIMKDSRIGAYGAIGIFLMLLLKCVTLAQMTLELAAAALLLAHPLSRLAAVSLVWRLDYAKEEGKARPLATQMTNGEFLTAALTVLLVVLVLGVADALNWLSMLAAIIAAALVAIWLARKFVRRIGGITGDCLGAVQQVSEVTIYLALLATVQYTY